MMMRLQHKRPDGEVDTYHLKPGRKYHFGRGSQCEIRILDLKLSRKHCVIEFAEGGWRIEDLCSTNGCKVDGNQIVGSVRLGKGAQIEAGATQLAVAALLTEAEVAALPEEGSGAAATLSDDAPAAPGPVRTDAARPASLPPSGARGAVPQQEPMPDGEEHSEHHLNDWEPEPAVEEHVQTGALQPIAGRRPPRHATPLPIEAPAPAAQKPSIASAKMAPHILPAGSDGAALAPRAPVAAQPAPAPAPAPAAERPTPKIKPVTIRVGRIDGPDAHVAQTPAPTIDPVASAMDAVASAAGSPPAMVSAPIVSAAPTGPVSEPLVKPATETTTKPGTGSEERTFFITVLGRRIGPLTRAAARDLKARELKGTLTTADLEAYPKA